MDYPPPTKPLILSLVSASSSLDALCQLMLRIVGANTDIYTFYSNTTTEFQKGDWWDIYLVPGDRVTSDNYREYFELSLPSFRVVDELSSEPQQNIRGSHCLGYYQQYQQYDGSTAELSQSDYNLGVAVIVGLAVGSAFIGFCGGVLLVLLSQCCYKRRRCHRLAVERHMVQPEISTTKREPTIEFQPRLLTESADHSHPKQELPLQHPGTPLAFNFDVPAAPISPPSPYAHELSASPVHPYTTIWQGPGLVKLDPVGRYNGSSVPDLSLVDEPGDIAPSPRRHLSPSPARKFRKTPGEPEFEMISKSSLHSINRVATPSNASQERPQT